MAFELPVLDLRAVLSGRPGDFKATTERVVFMKMKCARALSAAMVISVLFPTAGHSQYGSYYLPDGYSANPYGSFTRAAEPSASAHPYAASPSAPAQQTVSAPRTFWGWSPFGSRTRRTDPQPSAPSQSQTAATLPSAGLDYVQSPYDADVIYVEQISPHERPRPGAAYTVAAENAPPGSVSSLNRQINFPRDRGDDVDVLKLQIFLDYHGYSPGEIDGRWGYNTERALYVYQRNNGMNPTGQLDEKMLGRLNSFRDGYLVEYVVTQEDATGGKWGYRTIPRDYYQQAKLKWLPYETAAEALGEKFHCSATLLKKLNPGVDFDRLQPGQVILAPNVRNGIDEKRGKNVGKVRVSKYNKWTEVFDTEGNFMFYYPSTLGSEHDPLPLGVWAITTPVKYPPFKFQPKLFWDYSPNDPEALIPPGPNSPVGKVWIGTTRKSVGIHGTPNPENISKNTSHGCIRLTNWDAEQLASRVKPGTRLEFVP